MSVKIYLDLDGTVYNLYGESDWLECLENERSGLFNRDIGFFTKGQLNYAVSPLLEMGVHFGVITWLSMQSSPEYDEVCRQEKYNWVKKNLPFVTEFNAVPYGTPKQKVIQKKASKMYLIDDNIEVCKEWETSTQRKAYCVNNGGELFKFTTLDALTKILDVITTELKQEWD